MGIRFAVGVSIFVEGRTWGVMTATSKGVPSRSLRETESRIGHFTELMATAIANAEARGRGGSGWPTSRRRSGAWRRWSRTVLDPSAVFDAVTREVAKVLDASAVSLARYDDDVITVSRAVSGPPTFGSASAYRSEART